MTEQLEYPEKDEKLIKQSDIPDYSALLDKWWSEDNEWDKLDLSREEPRQALEDSQQAQYLKDNYKGESGFWLWLRKLIG